MTPGRKYLLESVKSNFLAPNDSAFQLVFVSGTSLLITYSFLPTIQHVTLPVMQEMDFNDWNGATVSI